MVTNAGLPTSKLAEVQLTASTNLQTREGTPDVSCLPASVQTQPSDLSADPHTVQRRTAVPAGLHPDSRPTAHGSTINTAVTLLRSGGSF